MGQQNSKDESVYQQVREANVEAIKALRKEGAGLEWINKEGKTPLIVACMDHRLYPVAETLVELGANVNAYRPGRHAGTPLHHAAKRGLDTTVMLLLSNGANPFVRNDDCQTALDVARAKECNNVIRAIEAHICYFCGEICEVRASLGVLESLVPQSLSRKRSKKSWVVVVPCSLPKSGRPIKLELAVYSSPQVPQPHTVISLWNCKIIEPKFQDSDPAMIIFDESTKTRYKFLSAIEGDIQQLAHLYNACKGLAQVMPSPQPDNMGTSPSSADANAQAANNPPEVAVATGSQPSSSSSATYGDRDPPSGPPSSKASYGGWADEPAKEVYSGWAVAQTRPTPDPKEGSVSACQPANPLPPPGLAAPSAPPMPDEGLDSQPIQYPKIDMSPVDLLAPAVLDEAGSSSNEPKSKTDESCCVICWEAPIEGACIPCGHMAGCMSCLSEIKAKKGVCPVCRTKMDQVIKLYAV